MMLINPLFDPVSSTWIYEETEAKSISELITKLGNGFRVDRYFPNGTPLELLAIKGVRLEEFIPQPQIEVPPAKELLETLATLAPLDEDFPQISDPVPDPVEVAQEPVKKLAGVCSPESKYYRPPDNNREEILNMWALGICGSVIAKKFGTPTYAIGRRVAWWRKKGDPRALVRNHKTIGRKKR